MRRGPKHRWIATLAFVAFGCSAAQQLAQSYLRKPTHSGMTSPARRAIENAIDKAVEVFESAWASRLAEKREADAREEEDRRERTAEAQMFYAELCTTNAPGAISATADGVKEKEAVGAYAAGDYARAAASLQAAYDARRSRLGDDHPEVARTANRLALAHLSAGDGRAAITVAVRTLEVRKQILKDLHGEDAPSEQVLRAELDVAESETTLAQAYRLAGAFDHSRPMLRHALGVRTRHLGRDHLCVAESQNNLGEIEYLTGSYPAAMELFRGALATREKRLGPDHRDVAQSLDNLGSLHKAAALYGAAKGYYERALASRRKLGEDHPEVAHSHHQLASLCRATGDYRQAEVLYEKALAIRRAKAPDGLEVAATESALAELHLSYGDYHDAERLLEHAQRIRKARLPADHPDLAESLANLAQLHEAKVERARAERERQGALAIWEKRFGGEHPAVASGAAALGELYLAEGRLDAAESNFARALAIRKQKLGEDHPATAESLHQLGMLQYARCEYGRAEPLFRSAIEIRAKKLGASHPDVAASLTYLGALLVATGRTDEALQAFRRAQNIGEGLVRSLASVASEARLDALLRFMRAQEEVVYSLLAEKDVARHAAPLALSVALLRKGRSVDETASISQAVYQGLNPEQRAKFEELRTIRAQIARQKLSPVAGIDPREASGVAERGERLEEELARDSAPIRARRDTPVLDEVVPKVAAALPRGTVLVEVVRYRAYRFTARPREPRWRVPRYAALVLGPSGAVEVADLGEAAPIDDAVKRFLERVTGRASQDAQADDAGLAGLSRALEARTVEPLAPYLRGTKTIVLAPDGQLNLLPFSALHDGERFLLDRFDITYVTSGRDLLPRPALRHSTEVALFASPEFVQGVHLAQNRRLAARDVELVEEAATSRATSRLSLGALRLKAPPSPLPGTEEEAKAIRKLLPRAKLFVGAAATKERFLSVESPAVVHVATHGLFRPDAWGSARDARSLEIEGTLLSPASGVTSRSEPLLNSMLLWSNVSPSVATGHGKAVVLEPAGLSTALEVAGMNLWGTQLVVLSACDTGRGQVDDLGQGVYGLRRAVMVAGAETLITSLWRVDDEVTRHLMTSYYARLLAGSGRGEALREASLAVRTRFPEPRYWAPFIAIGKLGPLDGLR